MPVGVCTCDKSPWYPTCSPPHSSYQPISRKSLVDDSQRGAEPGCEARSCCEHYPRPQYTLLARLGVPPPRAHSPQGSTDTLTHAVSGTFAHSIPHALRPLLHPSRSQAHTTPPPSALLCFHLVTAGHPCLAGPWGKGSRNSYKPAEPLVSLKATRFSDSSVAPPTLLAPVSTLLRARRGRL